VFGVSLGKVNNENNLAALYTFAENMDKPNCRVKDNLNQQVCPFDPNIG